MKFREMVTALFVKDEKRWYFVNKKDVKDVNRVCLLAPVITYINSCECKMQHKKTSKSTCSISRVKSPCIGHPCSLTHNCNIIIVEIFV